jgi:ADP-heptose:LPS heptosyltransferase
VSRQVLLINITRMGDLVQMGALLERLKYEQPDTAIDLIVDRRFAPVAEMLPHLRHILSFDFHQLMDDSRVQASDVVALYRDLKTWSAPLVAAGYDRVINLTFNRRSGLLTSYIGACDIRGVAAARDGEVAVHNPWMAYLTDMHHHRRLNQFNLVDIYAIGGGMVGPFAPLALSVSEDAKGWAHRFLAQGGAQDWVAAQVGASDPMKAWRPELFGQALAALSKRAGLGVVFIGGEDERGAIAGAQRSFRECGGTGAVLEAAGKTSVPQLAALLAQCRLLLTNDTGPMHVAVAIGTPVVDLSVGHVDFRETGPYGPGHWVVQPHMPCAPCGFDQVCFHHACKDLLIPQDISELCLHVLGRADVPRLSGHVRLYESRTDEDGLGSYRLQSGKEDASLAWYGRFWRRFWYREFTAQESSVVLPPEPPPGFHDVEGLLHELHAHGAQVLTHVREILRLTRQRPLPVRALQERQAAERDRRSRIVALSKQSYAAAPLAVALVRDAHTDDGNDMTSMAQSRVATYQRWLDRLTNVTSQLKQADASLKLNRRRDKVELARSA